MEHTIQLGEELVVATAEEQRQQWIKVLASTAGEIEIQSDRLQQLDTAGMQLLVAFRKAAIQQKKTLVFTGANAVLRAGAELAGLTAALFDERSA